MFDKLSGVLDTKTCICRCLEFGEVGKSLVCDFRGNNFLGSCCWRSAQTWYLLEAVRLRNSVKVNTLCIKLEYLYRLYY